MPDQAAPNQYRLIGERLPAWFIAGLTALGVAGSVVSARLLLAPETKIISPPSRTTPLPDRPLPPPVAVVQSASPAPPNAVPEAPPPVTAPPDAVPEPSPPVPSQPEVAPEPSPPVAAQPATEPEPAPPVVASPDPAPEPAPAPSDQPAPAAAAPDCPPLFTVRFNRGSVFLNPADFSQQASALSEWLDSHPDALIVIEGHADASGPEELNMLISHRRAKAVSELLANAGITTQQMTVRAFGEYAPLARVPAESGQNRRVSLRADGLPECQPPAATGGAP